MNTVKVLTLAWLSARLVSHAAAPDWEWARIAGGGSIEYEGGLAIGADGAVFVSFGTYGGRLGTFSTTQVGKMWARLDAQNNVQVAKNGPESFSAGNLKIAANGASDVFFSGSYYKGLTMGGFSAGTTDWGAVIGRMDTNCNVTWMKGIVVNHDGPCAARALTTDKSGNLIVATAFERISFDGLELGATPGGASADIADVAILKVRPDGTLVWMKKGGGSGNDEPLGVGCDPAGNVYVAGRYDTSAQVRTATFGTITLPANSNGVNGFVVKYSADGDFLWARSWGSLGSPTVAYISRISDVKINNDGRIFVVGVLRALQNDIPTSSGVGFLSEINANGDDIWTKTFPIGVHPFSVATSWNGDIAVASSFYGTIQTDGTTATSRGASDVLITCHDGTGRVRWAQSAGSSSVDYPLQINYGLGSSLFLIGITTGNMTFGSQLIDGIGNTDIFIAKLSPEGALLPRFTLQPQSVVVSGGMNVELTAAAVGDLPLTYQWWFNGAPLTGQTSPSLLLSNVRSESAGSYFVVAKNGAGETQSDIANVSYTDAGSLQLSVHPSLTIFGTPSRTYRIDYAVETRSPAVWTTITNISLPTTPYVWQDTNAAITDKRFYRVLLQP